MELSAYFKSIVDNDNAAIVVCDTEHTIIYMNPAACIRYEKRGGAALIGRSLKACHNEQSNALIAKVLAWFSQDRTHNRMFNYHNDKENRDVYMIALRDENGALIGYYEKHEYRDAESAKPYDFS